jgi:hypothetical protein
MLEKLITKIISGISEEQKDRIMKDPNLVYFEKDEERLKYAIGQEVGKTIRKGISKAGSLLRWIILTPLIQALLEIGISLLHV